MLPYDTLDVFDLFGIERDPAAPTTKTCSKCGEDKPLSEYNRDRKRKDGLQVYCKACLKAYREANKERIAARGKAYWEANKEKISVRVAAYREANKERIVATERAYREANRAKNVAYQREYRKARREMKAAHAREYREANKERIVATERARREMRAAYQREYREANKDSLRAKREATKRPRVYCITFANGCYYYGKSTRPDLRFNVHKSKSARGCHTAALNEQDWSTATWRVLVECGTEAEALEVESQIIEEHMDDPNCLNVKVKEKRSRLYWVYVLQSEQKRVSPKTGRVLPGYFYVGMTTDPARRLREHNGRYANGKMGKKGGGKWTSKHRPWVARACYGPYYSRSEALRAEYRLKHSKRGKARCHWTPEDSPLCRGEGVDHPWVADPVGWRPPKA